MTNIRQLAAEGLRIGDRFTITRRFTPEEIVSFASLSRDYNPVHCDSNYAKLKGLRAPIAHGLLTASLITEIGGQIGWLAMSMSFRFKRPIYADETLTCDWVILESDEKGRAKAEIRVINGDGITVLEAETTGVLPDESERQRLVEMLAEGDPTNGVTNPYA
ncbi:MaoC family dehydratase [Photorhabdus temperata]|uniref:MaoC family dehydratase n=1 Tax=Photorhabdus temperata TaxID=574560 RepID=UPI0021D4B366|nr:MaoC family dehydratase [Photorhabdus temperata]MCT8348619.1 MaoC family dehydratase [Photorhabdus temperata]